MSDLFRIRLIAQRSLKQARDVYAKTFGRSVNDPEINVEVFRLLKNTVSEDVVEVPTHLLLALLLREGGRKRGRQPQGTLEKRGNDLAVEVALDRKAELMASGMRAGIATERAATDAKNDIKCRISIPTIMDRMTKRRR